MRRVFIIEASLFNLFKKKPLIELAHSEEGTVYFSCRQGLTPGTRVKVLARLPEGEQFPVTVEVGAYDETDLLYAGVLKGNHDNPNFLPKLLAPRENRRRAPRINVTVGILSPELPGYKAITADLSITGACLIVGGPLNPGTPMRLELDLDAPGTSILQCEAVVRWCMENVQQARFLVGAQFQGLSRAQSSMLERYIHHVEDQRPE